MSTKFYLSASNPSISPNFSSFWNITSQADRKSMVTGKSSSPLVDKAVNVPIGSSKVLSRQYISDTIPYQVFSGTIKGQLMAAEDAPNYNCYSLLNIYIVNNTGALVQTLYTGVGSVEFADTILTNNNYPSQSNINTVSLLSGQSYRIVAEYGFLKLIGSASIASGAHNLFGNITGLSDLPIDTTGTSQNMLPWLEFSKTVSF